MTILIEAENLYRISIGTASVMRENSLKRFYCIRIAGGIVVIIHLRKSFSCHLVLVLTQHDSLQESTFVWTLWCSS
jgi:hypothetical protein